jgi:hypothetical protein
MDHRGELIGLCPDCYGRGAPGELLLRGRVATLAEIKDPATGRVWRVQGRIDGLGTRRSSLAVWVQGVQKGSSGKAPGRGRGRGA